MFLSNLSINRPVTITMFLLVFVVFGGLAYFGLTLNLMPDVSIPYVSIQTVYPGAGPVEVESQISKKIEDAVATISNIDNIESYSMENISYVIIKFDLGKDVDIANQEVKDKVDAILNNLPSDAEKPKIAKFDIGAQPIINLVLSGKQSLTELNEYADKDLKDRLSQIQGVAQVELEGGQAREIQIELNAKTVYQNSLSLNQLGQVLAAYNLDLPAGQFKTEGQELSVRVKGQYQSVYDLNTLDIPTATGIKKLNQIAKVSDSGEEVRKRSTFFQVESNKKMDNVIRINLIKSSDGNAVKISKSIHKAMPSIQKSLPKGMKLDIVDDRSIFVESSVNDTLSNIYMGILLTGLILLFFLHDLRSTLIVAISMPISIIATFMAMKMSGFSLNIMSLLGLSTSTGVLVTNSVVVLENIFRHKELGHNKKMSAQIGTSEIAVAVLASTLTNIVVFLPIGTMSSIVGQFFKEFGLTVTYATFFSLLISFTLTPMMASLILPEKKRSNKISEKLESVFNSWEVFYHNRLKVVLKSKKNSVMVMGISFILLIGSFYLASKVGFEFMPTLDEGQISLQVELPQGNTLEETGIVLNNIENKIKHHKEIEHILTTLGSKSQLDTGLNLANSNIKLVDAKKRKLTTKQVSDLIIRELAEIPNAKIKVSIQSSAGGNDEDPISFYILGYDNKTLEQLSKQIINNIKDIPGLINLDTSSRSGKPELVIVPDREKLLLAGTNVYELALSVRAVMAGTVMTRFKEKGNEYDLKINLEESSYNSIEKIKKIPIVTSKGTFVLEQLADINFDTSVNKIIHKQKSKSILISGSPASDVPLGNVTNDIKKQLDKIKFPAGYSIQWGGSTEMMSDAVTDMARALFLAILLTYMLLAAILESFIQPLMIMSTVPLALIGVFSILFITGQTMNIFSMMAIIMLVGIVVNNAILMLDYTNQLKRGGSSVRDSLLKACPTKLKPIIMSNLAIVLGMMPMAMGIGSAGKEFRQSMGLVSIGGLIASTILTLFVIPAMYYTFTRKENK